MGAPTENPEFSRRREVLKPEPQTQVDGKVDMRKVDDINPALP